MNNRVILLVEDDPSEVGLTRRAFEKHRIDNELVITEDGQDALDYLFGAGAYAGRDIKILPAVVLLDLKLPRVNGPDVLKIIRNHDLTKRLPVVVLSSSREDQDVAMCYDLGANSYIRKPVDFHKFVELVRTLGLYWLVLNESPPIP
jgi:two-component system response regulator